MIHAHRDRLGVPFHPGALENITRECWNALELLDPETGQVSERSAPVAEQLEVLARDDDALVVRRDRRRVEILERLDAPPRVSVATDSVGGEPGPILTPGELVVVTSTPETTTTFDLQLQVIDRSTGEVRWFRPFPLFRLPRSIPKSGGFTGARVWGAIAAAGRALYTAVEGEDDVTVSSYDLSSGVRGFEVSFPVILQPGFLTMFDVPLIQLVPIDQALLVIAVTAGGSVIARIA